MQQWAKRAITEFTFAGVTIVGCVYGCSTVLELSFAVTDTAQSGMASVVFCVLVSLFIAAYAVLWLRCSEQFGEYYDILATDKTTIQVAFTFLYEYCGVALGIAAYLLYSVPLSSLLPITYALVLLAALQFTPIFAKTFDRFRVQTNLLSIVVLHLPYLFAQLYPNYDY